MAYVTPSKLLPSSSTKSPYLGTVPNVKSTKVDRSKLLSESSEGESGAAVSTLSEIVKIYTKKVNLNKKSVKNEQRQKENLKRRKNENKLEEKVEDTDQNKYGFNIPGKSLVDKITRFIGFTAAGFLVGKIAEYLPIFKNVITRLQPIIDGIGLFVKVIGRAAITFVERGYKAVDTVNNIIKNIGGEGAEKTFKDFSSSLNTVLNGAIIAATIGLSTRPKVRGRGLASTAGQATAAASRSRGLGSVAGGYAGNALRYRAPGQAAAGGFFLEQSRKAAMQTAGRTTARAGARALKPLLSRIPIIGGLLEFAISWALGDPVGKAAFRGIGAVLIGAIGTAIGGPVGAVLGSMAGAEVGGLLYETFFEGRTNKSQPIPAASEGTKVTRNIRQRKSSSPKSKTKTTKKVSASITNPELNLEFPVQGGVKKYYGKGYDSIFLASMGLKRINVMNGIFGSLFGSINDMTLGQSYKSSLPREASESFAAEIQNNLNINLGEKFTDFLTNKLTLALNSAKQTIFNSINSGFLTDQNVPNVLSPSGVQPRQGPASGVKLDPGQPGVDFTPAGGNNRAVFPGEVVEIGHQYNPSGRGGDGRKGGGYGNFVVIRSEDPKKRGTFFDGLYAHFPDGEIKVKKGDFVIVGQNLGRMATAAEFADPATRKRVGSGTGAHTSLDFLKPDMNDAYPNYENLAPLVDPTFSNLGNQSFLPKNMRPNTELQQHTSYSQGGLVIHERNVLLYQKEVVLTG
jgi:hypothetical protein